MGRVKASYVAEVALRGERIGTPYSTLDCQALVEQLLTDAGVRHPNWRGSNHMWREALSVKGVLDKSRNILPGTWLFTVKEDGGEIARGYHDNEGNAAHVGMYLSDGKVIHSTTGGVQWDNINSRRWTHYGLCKLLDYEIANPQDVDEGIPVEEPASVTDETWKPEWEDCNELLRKFALIQKELNEAVDITNKMIGGVG